MVDQRMYKKIGEYIYDPDASALGAGAFGKVYRGWEQTDTNKLVAIKVIPSSIVQKYTNADKQEAFMREINVLKKIKGRHILEFKDAIMSKSQNLYIITSYLKDGNLTCFLNKEGGKLPIAQALTILSQICQAFKEIEDLRIENEKGEVVTIMHRDIKPENILMRDGEAILADFGFAKFIPADDREVQANHTKLGTPIYMSPQLLKQENYSYKCDIWSMGVVTYELIFGKKPWTGTNVMSIESSIQNNPLTFPETIPKSVEDLIRQMLSYEEKDRPDWNDILNHAAYQELSPKPEIGVKLVPEFDSKAKVNGSDAKQDSEGSPQQESIPISTNSQPLYENKKKTVRIVADS